MPRGFQLRLGGSRSLQPTRHRHFIDLVRFLGWFAPFHAARIREMWANAAPGCRSCGARLGRLAAIVGGGRPRPAGRRSRERVAELVRRPAAERRSVGAGIRRGGNCGGRHVAELVRRRWHLAATQTRRVRPARAGQTARRCGHRTLRRLSSGRPARMMALVHYARTVMRATLTYTLLRLLIFVAAALILALAGMRGIPLLLVALIISAIVSLPLLSRLRDRMSTSLSGRISRFHSKLDAGTRSEDID